jgi:peptidoglycan/LPS O-acetylase OafA/YrhL
MPSGNGASRVPALDGVRGVAILLVVFGHYGMCLIQSKPGSITSYALACLRLTWCGVDLFFVLSGFLIGGILIDQRLSQSYFQTFYVRRACRIFPLYFLMLLAFGNASPLAAYATFTQNIVMAAQNNLGSSWLAVTWSLAVEEQFYLLLPFVILYCAPRRLPWVLVGAIAAAPLLRLALNLWTGHETEAVYVLMPCRMDALLIGVLLAWHMRRPEQFWLNPNKLAYVGFGTLFAGAAFLTVRYSSHTALGMSTFGYTWMALLFGCLLWLVLHRRGFLHAAMCFPPLRWLGTIAYGVYLMHVGLLQLMHGLILHRAPQITGLGDATITLLALVVTLALAAVSYRYFEAPIIGLGRVFSGYKLDQGRPAYLHVLKLRPIVRHWRHALTAARS